MFRPAASVNDIMRNKWIKLDLSIYYYMIFLVHNNYYKKLIYFWTFPIIY